MKDKARIRLAAANGLVNLVQDRNYVDVITSEQYQQLSLTVMVRRVFSSNPIISLSLMFVRSRFFDDYKNNNEVMICFLDLVFGDNHHY